MSVDYKLIGSRIKIKRKENGLTQEKLAEKLNVTVGYVSQLERGITKISLGTLADVSTVLKCDISFFITGTATEQMSYLNEEFIKKYNALDSTQKKYILGLIDIMLN